MKMTSNRKWLPFVGAAIILALLAIVVYRQKHKITETKSYKIGVVAPLTGAGANLGTPFVNGLNFGIDEINANGGVQGIEIHVNAQDGKLDGKTSVDAANFLLAMENPDIFSVIFGIPALATSPVLEQAKKPMIYEAFTRSPLKNPYAFKANFDPLAGCEKLILYAKKHGRYKKLGILMTQAEYSQLCLEGAKKVESEISEYWYTFGEKDFRTLLAKANSEHIDSLIMLGIDYEFVNLFKQLSELGYPIKIIGVTASECIFPQVIASASPQVLEGTLSIDYIPLNVRKLAFGKKYLMKYPQANDTDLNYATVGYEEAQFLTKAFSKCPPGDGACLINSLNQLDDYPSVLHSNGFKDRVLQVHTNIYEFKNNRWNMLE